MAIGAFVEKTPRGTFPRYWRSCKMSVAQIVWVLLMEPAYQDSSPRLGTGVPVNYESGCASDDDFINLKLLCRLNISEMLVGCS